MYMYMYMYTGTDDCPFCHQSFHTSMFGILFVFMLIFSFALLIAKFCPWHPAPSQWHAFRALQAIAPSIA